MDRFLWTAGSPTRRAPIAQVLVLAASLTAATAARAQAPDTARCDSLPQTGLNHCYAALADSADAHLRTLIGELRGTLPASSYDRIRTTQTHWQRYRDGHCALAYASVEGGTIGPMVEAVCRLGITLDRIAELRVFLCEGGPVGEPCEASQRYGEPAAREEQPPD